MMIFYITLKLACMFIEFCHQGSRLRLYNTLTDYGKIDKNIIRENTYAQIHAHDKLDTRPLSLLIV